MINQKRRALSDFLKIYIISYNAQKLCDYLKYMYDLSYMINHVMYFGLKMNMFAAAFEKQPCRNISKINSSSEAAIKMHFSISLFCTCGEIL